VAVDPPPTDLLAPLSAGARERAAAWWANLTPTARVEFVQLWDARTDDTALYGTCEDGQLVWHELPIELRGTIVDVDDDDDHQAQKQQLLEYIGNHEDVQFFLVERRLHICRAHAAARAVISTGMLPADFVCPAAAGACPMASILAASGGRAVRLTPALRAGHTPSV
jgi:hypothetical protein